MRPVFGQPTFTLKELEERMKWARTPAQKAQIEQAIKQYKEQCRVQMPPISGGKTIRLPSPSLKPDGRGVRGQLVKSIMAKHGLSLPEASKYLKEYGSK
jgi:hypothetical protein